MRTDIESLRIKMDKSLAGFREWLGLDDLPDNPKILKEARKWLDE